MVWLRASSISVIAALALLTSNPVRADNLPTSAFALQGVATNLASREESNIMGRLRALRDRDRLTASRIVPMREPLIKPMQSSNEPLHDLRTGGTSPQPLSKHGTQFSTRVSSPALYKDMPTQEPAPKPVSEIEQHYNNAMQYAASSAGAPNWDKRGTAGAPQRQSISTDAEVSASQALTYASNLGGQGGMNGSTSDGVPRRTAITSMDKASPASSYRGQPLSGSSAGYTPTAFGKSPVVSNQPTPLTASATKSYDPYNVAPPVIYGANDRMPAGTAPNAPIRDGNFSYQRLNQGSVLTTPRIGSPSRAAVKIQQTNSYALAIGDDNEAPFSMGDQDETPLLAQSPDGPQVYGSQAVPLGGSINVDRRWGFFVSGNTGFGRDQIQTGKAKARSVNTGFTTGIDYQLEENSFVGLALTYVHSSFNTSGLGDLQGNSMAISLYGTSSFAKNAYADGYLSLGYHTSESERIISTGPGTSQTAYSSPSGIQVTGKGELGYDLKAGSVKYGPYTGFRLAYATFDKYTEANAGALNLKVKSQENLSAIGSIGVGASNRFEMSNGGTLLPGIRMGYHHEFGDDQSSVKAEVASTPGSFFTAKSDKRSRDWLSLSPSISAALPNDWTFVAEYEHDFFRDDVNESIFNLAAHYKW